MTRENSRPCFVYWCKRITMYPTGSTEASNAATEHADDDSTFRKLAKYFVTHELAPEKKNDPVYWFREDKPVTRKQRNLINDVLRKNMGDPRVAYYIFQHGVPTLLLGPTVTYPRLQRNRPDCYISRREMTLHSMLEEKALLQSMLEEFMTWHASLLRCLLERRGSSCDWNR